MSSISFTRWNDDRNPSSKVVPRRNVPSHDPMKCFVSIHGIFLFPHIYFPYHAPPLPPKKMSRHNSLSDPGLDSDLIELRSGFLLVAVLHLIKSKGNKLCII